MALTVQTLLEKGRWTGKLPGGPFLTYFSITGTAGGDYSGGLDLASVRAQLGIRSIVAVLYACHNNGITHNRNFWGFDVAAGKIRGMRPVGAGAFGALSSGFGWSAEEAIRVIVLAV